MLSPVAPANVTRQVRDFGTNGGVSTVESIVPYQQPRNRHCAGTSHLQHFGASAPLLLYVKTHGVTTVSHTFQDKADGTVPGGWVSIRMESTPQHNGSMRGHPHVNKSRSTLPIVTALLDTATTPDHETSVGDLMPQVVDQSIRVSDSGA